MLCKALPPHASFRLDVGGPDDLRPFILLLSEKRSEPGGRSHHRHGAEAIEARQDLWIGETSVDFRIELVDDFRGRIDGSTKAEPCARLVTGKKFGESWHPGNKVRSGCGRDGERP